jgi:hypothetical protein
MQQNNKKNVSNRHHKTKKVMMLSSSPFVTNQCTVWLPEFYPPQRLLDLQSFPPKFCAPKLRAFSEPSKLKATKKHMLQKESQNRQQ